MRCNKFFKYIYFFKYFVIFQFVKWKKNQSERNSIILMEKNFQRYSLSNYWDIWTNFKNNISRKMCFEMLLCIFQFRCRIFQDHIKARKQSATMFEWGLILFNLDVHSIWQLENNPQQCFVCNQCCYQALSVKFVCFSFLYLNMKTNYDLSVADIFFDICTSRKCC